MYLPQISSEKKNLFTGWFWRQKSWKMKRHFSSSPNGSCLSWLSIVTTHDISCHTLINLLIVFSSTPKTFSSLKTYWHWRRVVRCRRQIQRRRQRQRQRQRQHGQAQSQEDKTLADFSTLDVGMLVYAYATQWGPFTQ